MQNKSSNSSNKRKSRTPANGAHSDNSKAGTGKTVIKSKGQSHNSKNKSKSKMKQTSLVPAKCSKSTSIENPKQFVYETAMVSPASLRIHPLLEVIGYDAPDDVFIERSNHFKFYERSVITEDGYVITHPTDILAAQQSNVPEVEVVIMKNAMLNDFIDFISFKVAWQHGKSRRKIYELVKFLTAYVLQQDREWKKNFKSTKTRGIVAEMLGVSDGSIQNINQIAKNGVELLDKIDDGETNSSKVISLLRKPANIPIKKEMESRKRYGNLLISNNPNISQGEKALLKVRRAMFEIDELGVVEFKTQGDKTSVYINDVYITDVVHNVVSDTDYEGKREYSQHHTLLPNDDSFDVQFILKGLEKFIDNQNKLAA